MKSANHTNDPPQKRITRDSMALSKPTRLLSREHTTQQKSSHHTRDSKSRNMTQRGGVWRGRLRECQSASPSWTATWEQVQCRNPRVYGQVPNSAPHWLPLLTCASVGLQSQTKEPPQTTWFNRQRETNSTEAAAFHIPGCWFCSFPGAGQKLGTHYIRRDKTDMMVSSF